MFVPGQGAPWTVSLIHISILPHPTSVYQSVIHQRLMECLPYVGRTLGAADTAGIRWSQAGPSGNSHHASWFPTGRRVSLQFWSLLLHFMVDGDGGGHCIHPSGSAWHWCILILPCKLGRQTFYTVLGQELSICLWGMFPLFRETQMFKTVPRTNLHCRCYHFLHGVESRSIFSFTLNYQYLQRDFSWKPFINQYFFSHPLSVTLTLLYFLPSIDHHLA